MSDIAMGRNQDLKTHKEVRKIKALVTREVAARESGLPKVSIKGLLGHHGTLGRLMLIIPQKPGESSLKKWNGSREWEMELRKPYMLKSKISMPTLFSEHQLQVLHPWGFLEESNVKTWKVPK